MVKNGKLLCVSHVILWVSNVKGMRKAGKSRNRWHDSTKVDLKGVEL